MTNEGPIEPDATRRSGATCEDLSMEFNFRFGHQRRVSAKTHLKSSDNRALVPSRPITNGLPHLVGRPT